jgi:hypothetical protein
MRGFVAIAAIAAAAFSTAASARATDSPASTAETARAQASSDPLPARPNELVAYVTHALMAHDLDAFDRLVEWEGARPVRRRMTLYQLRYNFGRPIKSAAVESFPPDGLGDARALLNLKPNLPVTERLRVVFDEPPGADGEEPASVFLLGKKDGVYRISLLLGAPPK